MTLRLSISQLGKRNKLWLIDIFIFYNKWKEELPKSVINVSESLISQNNFLMQDKSLRNKN